MAKKTSTTELTINNWLKTKGAKKRLAILRLNQNTTERLKLATTKPMPGTKKRVGDEVKSNLEAVSELIMGLISDLGESGNPGSISNEAENNFLAVVSDLQVKLKSLIEKINNDNASADRFSRETLEATTETTELIQQIFR